MIHKEIHGTPPYQELYVWINGQLLYKRWLQRRQGVVFCYVWGGWTIGGSR